MFSSLRSIKTQCRAFSALKTKFVPGPQVAPPTVPVALRGRPGLPEWWNPRFPEFLAPAKEEFPKVYLTTAGVDGSQKNPMDLEDLGTATREFLEEELHKHGCILFRGMPMNNSAEFTEFVEALGWRTQSTLAYLKSMNARSMTSTAVSEHVRTASDEPPEYTIEPHSEYHTVNCPPRIMLYCTEPPTDGAGGEWIAGDLRKVYAELDPEVVEKFERLGVQYQVYYASKKNTRYNCWEQNIACTKEQVEEYLELMEYEWKWDEDDGLTYWKTIPAVAPHPVTGEKCWFNQMHAHSKTFYKDAHPAFQSADLPADFKGWPVESFYGDGSPIPDEVVSHVREVIWRNCVAVPMQRGDLFFCDNYLAMHGRMSFKAGSPRGVYVANSYD